MATTTLADEMLKNFVQLNTVEQKSVLQMIKTFLRGRKNDFSPQTIDEYNRELKVAMEGADKGEVTSLEKLEEEMKLW